MWQGLGVIAREELSEGQYVTEYKYSKIYPFSHRKRHEDEYIRNDEWAYILDMCIGGKKFCR